MISHAPTLESFAANGQLEAGLSGDSEPVWLRELRQRAWNHLQSNKIVDPRSEDWRFSRVAPLSRFKFSAPATLPSHSDISQAQPILAKWNLASAIATIVLIDGVFEPTLSHVDALPPGVTVGSLAESLRDSGMASVIQKHLGEVSILEHSGFDALNTCWFRDGAFVHVSPGVRVGSSIQILNLSTRSQSGAASYPRHLIVAEEHSQVEIVEINAGSTDDCVLLTDSVTEVVVNRGADVSHCRIQNENPAAFFLSSTEAVVAAGGKFDSFYVAAGSEMSRNEVGISFAGERASARLTGLYRTSGSQHSECRTRIEHAMPNCVSDQVYKGVLSDSSAGVFNGKIHVHQDAQKTDARQNNRALLLSDDASVQTQPQLEIYADDVKCTHGATVGHPDESSMFYLRSRGIPEAAAQQLLMFGFANEAIERCPVSELQPLLTRFVSGDLVEEYS